MGECLILRRGGETYKPAILNAAYPQDVSKTVIKGNTTSATFNVLIAEAGNPAEYTYQWYKNGSAVSGATGASYTITGLSTTATHTVYCEVTNKGGMVKSRVATLKVTQQYTPTLSSSYPANVTGAEVGGSATFKVTIATAGVPASYTYQWYVNGSAVSGATGSSYTRSNLAKGSYTVYCKVTNAAGTVQSRTATLTVTTLYLYKTGTDNTSVTGGWAVEDIPTQGYSSVSGNATLTKNAGNMVFTGGRNTVWTGKKINMSNYSKLTWQGSVNGYSFINVADVKAKGYNNVAYTDMNNGSTSCEVDVSSLSGEYYVVLVIMAAATAMTTTTVKMT